MSSRTRGSSRGFTVCVVLVLLLQAAAPAVSPILPAAGPTPAAPPDPPEVLAPAPPPEPEAAPVAPETSPAEPEASPEPLLSAHLALEPAIARPNDVVTATLAVTNTGDLTAAHLVAAADLPLDLRTPIDGRQLQIPLRDLPPGASLQESFQLQVAGLPARPIELVLTISADDPAQPVRAAASLAVLAPSPTRRELGTDGGEFLSPDGRLQVAFPAGWSAEPAEVTYTAVEWHRIGEGDGVAVGFTLEAVGAISGEPIGRFSRPVTVTLALTGLLDFAGRPSNHFFMRHRAEPDLPWEWVEVTLDREGGVISGALNHFSEIEGGGETAEGWKLLTNLPAVSTFSGAATYRYSIEVPPGRNGLQPSLPIPSASARSSARPSSRCSTKPQRRPSANLTPSSSPRARCIPTSSSRFRSRGRRRRSRATTTSVGCRSGCGSS